MNNLVVQTVEKGIESSISVPGSKSLTNRALLMAALSKGNCRIINPLFSDDTEVMIAALKKMNIPIEKDDQDLIIHGQNGKLTAPNEEINLHNAGTAMRFLTASCLLAEAPLVLTGIERMKERPIKDLVNALNQMSVNIEYLGNEGYPPLRINANGQFPGGNIEISGKLSSQYISALLLVAPYAQNPTTIKILGNLVSKSYIDLTLQIMSKFGIEVKNIDYQEFSIPQGTYGAEEYIVEADASSASYFFGIAALNKGEITVNHINKNTLQGDIKTLDVLEKMGCKVHYSENSIKVIGPEKLKALGKINLNHMPDAAMTIAVIAAMADGKTEITDVANLRIKETDRIAALVKELNKVGIDATETDSGLIIKGSPETIHGAEIDTYNDHRMAMCFGMLGTRVPEMKIRNPECTDKTYPLFWDDLNKITKHE